MLAITRLFAWSGALVVLALLDGLAWAATPVWVPLWALLVLTLLPAESIGMLAQALVDRLTHRVKDEVPD